ncbi:MAG: PEP-CTERM sorting domain-containing protein [Lentisphaeria bacterium]|nr:PEP-CTERM sorting domain-containing protein [Lentisphaeria bacterium]
MDLGANGGINPATGAAWQLGDQYRFAFVGSANRQAQDTDIAVYNSWAQGLADASALGIGTDQGVTWNVIGSTSTVNARDNTSTNPNVNGTGETIYLLDGGTVVAINYAQLWDGTIDNAIAIDENGNAKSPSWAFTGTYIDGTNSGMGATRNPLGVNEVSQAGSTLDQWIWRVNTSASYTNSLPMYAMSDPLTIVPEPSTALLAGLGLAGLVLRRRRGK